MRLRSSVLALIVVAALLAACAPGTTGGGGSAATNASTAASSVAPVTQGGAASSASPFVAPGASVRKVVVNVGIEGRVPGSRTPQNIGNGSGIIIRSDGYILTNDHVVSGSSAITAQLGTETIPAKVVGEDPSTDLAVIKVARTGLPAATIGDPSKLQVGDWVIAVGYPFGVGATVTHGIVSALGRSTLQPQSTIPSPHGNGSSTASSAVAAYTDLIQTDAPINPGNSGGALATLDGSIIGVNTLIESQTGASAGIGFAIPIDFAMNVADQLIKTGKAVHPFLGILITDVQPGTGQSTTATQGVYVQEVQPGRAAAKAGLRAGDVIVQIGGMPVADVEDLYSALRQQKIGSTVPVVVVRGGKQQTIQVTIGSDK